ncbi:MAG: T3SS effector HopA1 family protein [Waterburya sp.]
MQLLDSQPNLKSTPLQIALEDIVNQVQIESNFCIRHPNYQPVELPPPTVERFQKLPTELQSKYLAQILQGFLYGIYYNGSLKKALALDNDLKSSQLYQDLENNTFLGVDLDFYDRLHQSNQGQGYFDPGWQIIASEIESKTEDQTEDILVVTKGGLTLHVNVENHLPPEAKNATIGDLVAIRLPKNRVQNGFYMAVGNTGARQTSEQERKDVTVRIYFNLTAEGAIAIMTSLTTQLNSLAIPFSFKALYNSADYGRHDSAVLYFDSRHYEEIKQVLETVYSQQQEHFQPEIPLFTKQLAPGLALAEEPDHKFSSKDSFGTNRCQIIANGLLAANQSENDTPESRLSAIAKEFDSLGIELERCYLNANSEDIYTPLNL